MRSRRLSARLLCAALALSALLSGCGIVNTVQQTPGQTQGTGDGYVWVPEFIDLASLDPSGVRAVLTGGLLWVPANRVAGYEDSVSSGVSAGLSFSHVYSTPVYEPVLYTVTPEGEAAPFEAFSPAVPPEGMSGSGSIRGICSGSDGGLLLVENCFASADTGDKVMADASSGDLTPVYRTADLWLLHIYGPDGDERGLIDLSELLGEDGRGVSGITSDGSGYIYILDGSGRVLVLDRSGGYVSRGRDDSRFAFISSIGGRAYGLTEADGGWELWTVDPVNGAVSRTVYTLPQAAAIHFADTEFDLLYCEGQKLMGLDLGGEPIELLDLLDCGLSSSYLTGLFRLGDAFLCLLDEPDGAKLARLVHTPMDEAPVKKQLTLACAGLDYGLQKAVYLFNRERSDAYIEVIDYGEGADSLTRLAADAGAGELPDILCTAGLPLRPLISRGYLLELTPFIDRTVGFDALVGPLFDAMRVDGGLYEVAAGFSISAVAAPAELEGTGLDAAKLAELTAALPEGLALFDRSMSPYGMFRLLFEPEEWIDWETGECRFDSEEFVELLNFAATYPSEPTNGADEHLLSVLNVGSLPEHWLYDKAYYGGGMAALGYPGGEGGVFGLSPLRLGISSSCADAELAWEFVVRLLDEELQTDAAVNGLYLPSSAAALEALLDGVVEEGEAGRYTVASGGVSVSFGPEDAEALMRLIDSTTRISGGYGLEVLEDIAAEETARFFSGACTAEECAALVQDRAYIYVNEQR